MLTITWHACTKFSATLYQFATRTHGESTLQNLLPTLLEDECGFIVSTELVLVSTIAVLSMVVGLSQVADAMSHELADVSLLHGGPSHSYQAANASGHAASELAFGYRDAAAFD